MGLNIVKEGSWLYFVKGEVRGEHTFPTCLELPCSNSLHSDYATFEITCGVPWYLYTLGLLFVDRKHPKHCLLRGWPCICGWLRRTNHCQTEFCCVGVATPRNKRNVVVQQIQTLSSNHVLGHTGRIFNSACHFGGVLTISRLSLIELMGEVRANDNRLGFSKANTPCTEKKVFVLAALQTVTLL